MLAAAVAVREAILETAVWAAAVEVVMAALAVIQQQQQDWLIQAVVEVVGGI